MCLFKKYFIYLFLERGEGKEKERERNINVWLPLVPLSGGPTWPTTQACAQTGNLTGDPLVCRPTLNPLSHTSQGQFVLLNPFTFSSILTTPLLSGSHQNVLYYLWVCFCVSVLLVSLFCFLDSIVDRYVFMAILLFIFFILFFFLKEYPLTFYEILGGDEVL